VARSWRDRVVHEELSYWGYWQGLQLAADGAPPQSIIKQLDMPPGPRSRDKILILDPPKRWWPIHRVILTLEYDHRKALIARYAVPPREDGTMRTHGELAEILGWWPEEYSDKLRAAKRSYKVRVFGG